MPDRSCRALWVTRMVPSLFLLLAAGSLVAAQRPGGAAPRGGRVGIRSTHSYTLIDLGLQGGIGSTANALNDSGVVVGTILKQSGEDLLERAFRWENGTAAELGALGGQRSEAFDVNNAGVIVGAATLAGEAEERRAFRWQNGTMTDLKVFSSAPDAEARAITQEGVIVGSAPPNDEAEPIAFRLQGTTASSLGTLAGGANATSTAFGVNEAGTIVGSSGLSTLRAFIHENGAMTDLGPPGKAVALSVNASRVVVGEFTPTTFVRAFRWENGQFVDIGTLGGNRATARGINDAGDIVGQADFSPTINFRLGFLRRNGTMANLNELIQPNSGLRIIDARDINNRGEIVGTADDSSRALHAILLSYADLSTRVTTTPERVTVGGNLLYNVTVTNRGPLKANGVTLTAVLPTGAAFNSTLSTAGATLNGSTVNCPVPALDSGASATVTIGVNPTVTGTLNTTFSVTATEGDPNRGDNGTAASVNVVPLSADLTLALNSPVPAVTVGGNVTYTAVVKNEGPDPASGVILSDPLPAGLTFNAALSSPNANQVGNTVNYFIGSLPVGGTSTLTIVAGTSQVGSVSNTASVTATEGDPVTANNSATVSTNVVATSADLGITITGTPAQLKVGGNITYSVSVTNAGPNTATAVLATDPLPAGTTFVAEASSPNATLSGGKVSYNLGLVAVGGSVPLTIVLNTTAPGTIRNTVNVAGEDGDPNTNNNSASVETTVQPLETDLSVTLSASPSMARVRDTVTYTIGVTNNGPDAATGVTVTDTLPAGVTFLPDLSSPNATVGHGAVGYAIGSLASGGAANLTVAVRADAAGTLNNTVSVSGDQNDGNSGNNSAGATTPVVERSADLGVTMTAAPSAVKVGERITFSPTVTNGGPDAAEGSTLTVTLPAGTTFVADGSTPGGTVSGSTVTFALGSVPAGASLNFAVVATTNQAGTLTASAAVAAATGDPSSGNNSASAGATAAVPVPPLARFTVSPKKTKGGKPLTAQVTLSAPAPAGGAEVVISSDAPFAVSGPVKVAIAAGKTSPSRPAKIRTFRVHGNTRVTLSATAGGKTLTASVLLTKK